jgi:molecular chaperone DnaK
VGEHALNVLRGSRTTRDVIRWVKRFMGANEVKRFVSGGQHFSPAQVSAHFILTFLRAAERQLGLRREDITKAVVTVPAYFGHRERRATVEAAEQHANLSRVYLLDEPVAAAIGLELHKLEGSKLVLVFDLGGGTFDVTLLRAGTEVGGGGFDELGRSGDSELGGLTWDQEIARYVVDQKKKSASPDFLELDNVRLYEGCEIGKKDLCTNLNDTLVTFRDRDQDGQPLDCTVTREWFERNTEDLADYCIRVCEHLFEEIPAADLAWRGIRNVTWKDLDGVYLVGGSCRMPMIRRKLKERWGREPIMPDQPQHAVARGAAVYAAALLEGRDDSQKLRQFNLRSPHSTGVHWLDTSTGAKQFHELISRNTRIPVERKFKHAVVGDGKQLVVEIGEERISRFKPNGETVVVHELVLDNLPPRNGHQPEFVTFTVRYPNDRELQFTAEFRGKEVSVRLNEKHRPPPKNGS